MDLSFKSVLKAIKSKTQLGFCEALGVGKLYSKEFFEKLNEYIFPKKPTVKTKKSFDFNVDFRLLWSDFKAVYNIDLINDKINWWQFQTLFERITLLDNISGTSKVIGYRSSKIPKSDKHNRDQVDHLRNMKARYRLEEVADESVGNFISGLFRRAKKAKK